MMPDQSTIRALLREIGMDVPEDRITQVKGGTVNLAFRIEQGSDGPLIMRLSPTNAEAEAGPSWLTSHGLRREQTTLALLDDLASLLPRTVYFDESREHIDRDWVLQTWVPGAQWQEARPLLDEAEEMGLWRELGTIVRRMHAIVGQEFGPPEAGLGYATWSDLLRWDAAGLAVDAQRYGIETEVFEGLQAAIDRGADLLNRITEPRLIHSDLNPRHVFVAPDDDGVHRITGMIDFEFARFADARSESVFIEPALMPSHDGRDVALCEGYRCEPPDHDDQVRERIYTLVAMGWTVTDLARRDQPGLVPDMLTRMDDILKTTREAL